MTWWQLVLLVAGTIALFAAYAMLVEARYAMWTYPKVRAQRWAFVWLIVSVWCGVFGLGILP